MIRCPYVIFEEIFYGDRVFNLKYPLEVEMSLLDDVWILEDEQLGLCSFDVDKDLAIEGFMAEFSLVWDFLSSKKDDELTE